MRLSELKTNPTNPRTIKDDKFKKLVQSLKDFPEMMEKRPLVCVTDTSDGKLYPLGGNMRLKALNELKYKDIPDSWVMIADDWTEEQRREFIIKDNVGYGEWDEEVLRLDWDVDELDEWGLELGEEKEKKEEGEIRFSEELDRESNYIVLKFTSDIDFIWLQTILELETTYSKRANGKAWSKGMGRVVDGVEAIEKLKNS